MMRFLNSVIAAALTGTLGYLGVMFVSSFFWDSSPGSMDGFGFLILSFPLYLFITILLIFVFFFLYNRINVHGMVFGGVIGILVTELIRIGLETIPFQHLSYYYEYRFVLILMMMVAGLILVKKTSKWYHHNGFILGSITGLVLSYSVVILMRAINNSLTSYFYLDSLESFLLLSGTTIGAIIGNLLGQKRFVES